VISPESEVVMRSRLLAIGLSFAVAVLTLSQVIEATAAYAASDDDPGVGSNREGWRDGWVLGIGFLGGIPINNDCPDCYTSFGVGMNAHLGRMLNPRMALMLDTHGVAVGRSEIDVYGATANALVQGVAAIAVQYWAGERLWIKGGIGMGEVRGSATVVSPSGASVDILETEKGFGTLAAAGYELYQGQTMGVNLHARYAGIYGDGLSRASLVLGLGVAWYP
jgi:hypothetical protein